MYLKIIVVLSIVVGVAGCSGKTSKELCEAGIKELQRGNSGWAIVLFRNALEKDPNFVNARYHLARAYMASGKFEQAEKEYQKVQRQNPSLPDIKLDLARLYCCLNKPELATREGEEYLAAHPGSADALEALGIAYAAMEKFQDAETCFLRALERDPAKLTTKLALARLYAAQGTAQKARDVLMDVIKASPGNPSPFYMLADLELAAGEKEKALALYEKMEELHGPVPAALYKAGLIHLEKGDFGTAEKTAEKLVARFPNNGEGYRLKGIICYQLRKFPEAIAALQVANKFQPTVAGYYFLGLSLYDNGEFESALSQFRVILDKDPSFHEARLLAGMILLRQKRIDDAIAEIDKLLEEDGRNALAHNILGSAYMAKGMYDDGMKELNRAIALNPRIVDAHLKKGVFHLSRGKTGEFEADLKTAIQVAPEVLNTRLLLASYYMYKKNHAKALAVLNEGLTGGKSDAPLYSCMAKIMFAAGKPTQGIQYMQKAKESDPGALEPYFMLASYYAVNGDDDKVVSECSAVLQKEPGNVKAMLCMAEVSELRGRDSDAVSYYLRAKKTGNPLAYLLLASYYAKKKDNGKALAVLDEAARNTSRSAAVLEMKGRLQMQERQFRKALKTFDDVEAIMPDRGVALKINAYMKMNNPSEALNQANRIVTMHPDSASGYMLLADVYRQQNKTDQAIAELKKGLGVDGKNPQAELMLAEMYARADNYPLAIKTCEDAIRVRPDSARAYVTWGVILDAAGKKKEAVKKYQNALTLAEDYVPALNNLAYLYADGYGDKGEALRLAKTALTLKPEDPQVMDTLGYALLKNGRLQDARRTLEKAAILLPDNPTINFHLALVYKALGERGAAVAMLQKALSSGEFMEKLQARTLWSELN